MVKLLNSTWLFKIILILIMTVNELAHKLSSLEIKVCYNNSSEFGISNDEPKVFDINIGSAVHLWCHYCNEKENYNSKLWFYKPRGSKQKQKMKEIDSNNGIAITLSHTLNINCFLPNNSGIYTCKSYGSKNDNAITYVLDGVMNVVVNPKIGRARQWQEYKRTYIDAINKKFKTSDKEPYYTFRKQYNLILRVHTVWDDWSECKESNLEQSGMRKRLGRCRISPIPLNDTLNSSSISNSPDIVTSYLTDGFAVPCRSVRLNDTIPEISKIIKSIPEFEAIQICPMFLKPAKYKRNKESSVIKTVKQVMENSHVTLICSEFSNSDIKWFKDKKLLKSLYGNVVTKRDDESHITLDSNNSLHLLRISKNEEGVYTCSNNGRKVKQFEVKVVTKSNLLNQEFIRYSIYLGFVLSLTMTCYCAGVCVAWHRRASFVDPLSLYIKKPCRHLDIEREKLLG